MRPATRRPRADPAAPAEGSPHLVFGVEGEEYAVPLLAVREIVRVDALQPVPDAPDALRGTLRLGDATVFVVDLSVALSGRKGRPTRESCALIASTSVGGVVTLVGLAVDDVRRVIVLTPALIAPAPRLGTLVAVPLVAAMARAGEDLLPILDLERLLASDDVRAAIAPAGRYGASP